MSVMFAITRMSMKSASFPLASPPLPPPPTTPLPPPGWLMEALVFHQGIFARWFLHFFAVICCCQILARWTQGCDWQISPTPPLPPWLHPGSCQAFKDISCTFGALYITALLLSPEIIIIINTRGSHCLCFWKCQKCWYHSVLCVASYKMF